jgi:tetratricopeptide (TPR) repeat protein
MERACRALCAVAILATVATTAGCGGGGAVGEIRAAFERGDYTETVGLSRHALRRGEERPIIHLYNGLGLVGLGRDHEGFDEIGRAVDDEPSLAPMATEFLMARAADKPGTTTSARRMREAWRLDASIDLGRNAFSVADVCYGERSWEDAAGLYTHAIAAFPDTAACEAAYARLAECYLELRRPDQARKAMETLVERYPRGQLAGRAMARLDDVAFDQAQAAYNTGEYSEAVELAADLVTGTANRSLQQKARYLLGESYEASGDTASAYAAYRDIIRSDRGDSGRVVERARARMEALQEAGLR